MGRGRIASFIAVIVVLAAVATTAAAAPSSDGLLTSKQLVYAGATVKVEVDVNGEAAAQLVGGMLDAAAESLKEQAANLESAAPLGKAAMAAPFIEPASNAIKSLDRVIAVVMKTEQPVEGSTITAYYGAMMAERGWVPLASVRTDTGQDILLLMAPGAKGVFACVRPNESELIVALAATRQPIGDLLAQIVKAGGGALPQILQARAEQQQAAQQQAECKEAKEAQESDCVETAEAPSE